MKNTLNDLEKRIGYRFRIQRRLEEALTHSSIKDEKHPSNERLEFLGDAVLGLAVTEYVYKSFPELSEGELTAIKSVVVSSDSLLKIARALKLRQFISVGRGITKKRSIPSSLVANAVEALIGAIYLDSGYRAARCFALAHVELLHRAGDAERQLGLAGGVHATGKPALSQGLRRADDDAP